MWIEWTTCDELIRILVRSLYPRLYGGLVSRFRLSPDDASDIVNDALLSIMDACQRGVLPHDNRVKDAYIWRAARNKAYDFFRKARNHPEILGVETDLFADQSTEPIDRIIEENEERSVLQCRVDQAMPCLSLVERRIIELRLWERLSWADVGVAMNCSENLAHVRYKRAIKKLKRHIGVTSRRQRI